MVVVILIVESSERHNLGNYASVCIIHKIWDTYCIMFCVSMVMPTFMGFCTKVCTNYNMIFI